jgi:hypothetical protein
MNEHWTAERLVDAAKQQLYRHEQLIYCYPRMDPSDSPGTAIARAYLAATANIQELTAILALRNKTLELYELRIEKISTE